MFVILIISFTPHVCVLCAYLTPSLTPWMTEPDVEQLLSNEPDLRQYIPLFKQHSIRGDVFDDLSLEDLAEMGVPLGHRIKIMRLITNGSSLRSLSDEQVVELLATKCESFEVQLKKLSDQILKFRTDILRLSKESEPLPTPVNMKINVQAANLSTETSPKTTPKSANSYVPLQFHDSFVPQANPPMIRTSSAPEVLTTKNLSKIDLNAMKHSIKCSEKDNTVEVLNSMARIYKLDGDIKKWRLQLKYGEHVRDLLDHEHPLVIYRQMKEGGYQGLTFQARKVTLSRPPVGNFI